MKILTTHAVMAASVGVAAIAWTTIAQMPLPPSSGSQTGSYVGSSTLPPSGSQTGSYYGASGSLDSGSQRDTFMDNHSGSGSWLNGFNFSGSEWNWNSTYNNTNTIEYTTGMDGQAINVRAWHKYYFDIEKGFTTGAQSPVDPWVGNGTNATSHQPQDEPQIVISPGHCPHRFCIYVVFESDYGAMDTFDSFVMDRFEASTLMGSEEWAPNGPVPLILGRMPRQAQASWGMMSNNSGLPVYNYTNSSGPPRSNYTQGFNGTNATNGMGPSDGPFLWNDPRRTVWTLYPLDNSTNQVDLVMSFKQLYTLLPNYTGPLHSNGPFYSADLTDQLILRLTAGIPSEFSAMSSLLPVVVDHIGNKLVDISYSSQILYPGLGFDGGNELQLNLKIQRRRFHAFEPWLPARSSSACRACDQQLPLGFKKCFDSKVGQSQMKGSARAVWEDLLHVGNDRQWFNAEPYGEICFEEIMDGQWRNISESPDSITNTSAAQLLAKTDAGLRCMVETQCPISGPGQKNDGRVVTMDSQPARTEIHFEDPNYTLYLHLATTDELQDTHTTQVFSGNTPASMLKEIILSAIPGVQDWNIDLEVRKYDNLAEIAQIEAENARLQTLYGNATIWAGSASDGSNDGSDEMGSGSGMMRPSPSSFPSPSPSPSSDSTTPAPPQPAGRRRRLMGVSSDGSSDAGSKSESDPRAPKPPQFVPVPKPRYSIELLSHNVTLGIQVMGVFTSFPVQWQTFPPSLTFGVTKMKMDKFVFNPPPQDLNLEWRDPFTNPVKDPYNSSRQLPMFPPGDACSECMGAYMDCLLDTDCAYGVRTYLWGALQPFLYESGNQTHTTRTQATPQSPVFLEAHMTEVFRTARAYFPPRAYDRLSRYLTCLAKPRLDTKICNIDGDHRVIDPRNGSWVDIQRVTSLRLIPARVEITMSKGSLLTFSVGNLNSSWYEDGTVSGLRNALLNTVFRQAPNSSFAFQLNVSQHSTEDNNVNKVVYSITLNNYMGDIPQFTTFEPDSFVVVWPWEIFFEGMDDNLVQDPQDILHWDRLMDWLQVFNWYDLSGGVSNGYGNPDGNPTWTPPPPQAPHAICSQCSGILISCLSNYECANTLRTRISTDLNPSALSSLNPPYNNMSQAPPTILDGINYRTILTSIYEQWHTNMSSSTFNQIDSLIQCLANSMCPVGYSMNGTTSSYPTVIEYTMVKQFLRPWGSSSPITFTYFDPSIANRQPVTRQITYTTDFVQFIGEVYNNYDTDLHYNIYPPPDGSPYDIITIEGSPSKMNLLHMTVAPEVTSAKVSFVSLFPARTTWDYLYEWVSIAPTNGTNPSFVPSPINKDPCFQCQGKIQECKENGDCWQSIQEVVLPALRGNRGTMNSSLFFNDSQIFTREDFGGLLRMQAEIQSHTMFSAPGAFDDFIDILQCLQQVQCDISYTEGAAASPATAHNPTYLVHVQPESAVLTLYINTDLSLSFNGMEDTYTEAGNPNALRNFLNNALGGNVAFNISDYRSDYKGYHYTIRYPHFYSDGQAPFLQIGSNWGQMNGNPPPVVLRLPWSIYFQSYQTVPALSKLTDMLSIGSTSSSAITNTSGTMTGYKCDVCSTALTECWNDFSCQYMLTTSAIPMLNTNLDTLVTFNSMENIFQADFSTELLYNILPMATTLATRDRFFNLLDCHARSPCVTESINRVASSDWVDLIIKPAQSRMQVPVGETFIIYYKGVSLQYQDSDNTANLKQVLESQVLMNSSVTVEILRTLYDSPGYATYTVSYFFLYDVSPPHFLWPNSTGSQDTAIQSIFKSTTIHLKDALSQWMAGLELGP